MYLPNPQWLFLPGLSDSLPPAGGGSRAVPARLPALPGPPGFFVTGGDLDAAVQQQPDQGLVADTDADDGHGLATQGRKIFLKFHGNAPNAAPGGRD